MVLVLLLAALVAGWLLLPGFVTRRLVAEAAARGVDLQIGAIDVGMNEIVLSDVSVAMKALPELRATASGVRVGHAWLDVKDVALEGVSLDLVGDAATVQTHATQVAANSSSADPTAGAPPHVSVVGKLSWKEPFGDNTRTGCDRVTLDLPQKPGRKFGEDVTIACDGLHFSKGTLTLGPWSVSASRDELGDHFTLDLHPGASIMSGLKLNIAPNHLLSWDVTVAHANTTELGIPPQALSLVSLDSPPTLDVAIHFEEKTLTHAIGTVSLKSDAVPIAKGHTMPLTVSGGLDGDPHDGLKFNSQIALIGVFSGTLMGTIVPLKTRADLVFESTITSCADVTTAFAAQAFGPIGQQLGGLMQALGGNQGVKGSITLHADIVFDGVNPAANHVSVKPSGDCALNLFP